MPTRTLTTSQLAEVLDIHVETLKAYVARGCPCDRGGKGGKSHRFDEAEVVAWMKANNLTGEYGKPKSGSEELERAKIRKETALARKYELDVAKAEGLLVAREDVERENVQKITVVRNRLLGLGAKLAPVLEGMSGAERQRAIDDEVQQVLADFARGN